MGSKWIQYISGTTFHDLTDGFSIGIFPGFDKDGTVLGIKDDGD
jgi:hypothetical protein